MANLHEEIWHYQDDRVFACVVRSIPHYLETGMGELRIDLPGRERIVLPVPISPDSPTDDDDMQWFSTVQLYTQEP